MLKKNSIFVAASLVAAMLWGCGSNYTSGGDQTGPDNTLANAATVGMGNCLTCHSPFSTLIQDYLVSRHGNHMPGTAKQANDTETPDNDPSPGLTTCSLQCHDPYGDGINVDLVEAQAALVAFGNSAKADWTVAAQIVGCEACHGGGQFHNGIAAGIPYATPGPNQCGKCHGATEALAEAGPWGSEHLTSSSGNNVRRNILDSHYDNPATGYGKANNLIEGYAIRADQQNGCVDCHFGGHLFDLTINYEWANSAHGGRIKSQKDAALAAGLPAAVDAATRRQLLADVTAAGVTSVTGDAWLHYDWEAKDRQSCQRCHTSTGVMNFLANPAGYDQTANNYSHLAGWSKAEDGTITSSGQNEMLYCWGCHSDSKGGLRDPGALTISYSNSASATFPDSRGANVCISCHSGRENGDSIKNDTDADGVRTFLNSHYLTAGGTVFATSGYEYEGRSYDFTAGDQHQNLGYGTSKSTGNATYDAVRGNFANGPCVTCHFGSNDGSHTLSPFTEYSAGDLALNPVCVNCHSTRGAGSNAANAWLGVNVTEADLVAGVVHATHKGRYLAALEALKVLLSGRGMHFYEAHPYYFKGPNGTGGSFTNWAGVLGLGLWKDSMGAAFNYNLLAHDPGGVAHNRRYTRRLIYDSIDLLDDGIMNYSVSATLNALDVATTYKASAINYLIAGGTAGTAGERY